MHFDASAAIQGVTLWQMPDTAIGTLLAQFSRGSALETTMGLPRELVTPDLACLGGRPERMSTCLSLIPVSSVMTLCVSRVGVIPV